MEHNESGDGLTTTQNVALKCLIRFRRQHIADLKALQSIIYKERHSSSMKDRFFMASCATYKYNSHC